MEGRWGGSHQPVSELKKGGKLQSQVFPVPPAPSDGLEAGRGRWQTCKPLSLSLNWLAGWNLTPGPQCLPVLQGINGTVGG